MRKNSNLETSLLPEQKLELLFSSFDTTICISLYYIQFYAHSSIRPLSTTNPGHFHGENTTLRSASRLWLATFQKLINSKSIIYSCKSGC